VITRINGWEQVHIQQGHYWQPTNITSFTWTCLHYSTEACAAPGPVSSTGTSAAPGRVCTTESCAAPRRVYFTGAWAAPGPVYTSSELVL
jgi:hypothetical protein